MSEEKAEKASKKDSGEGQSASPAAKAMVRISPESPEYAQFRTKDGWLTALGKRVPHIHKGVRVMLEDALEKGCAFYATSGGIRVLSGADGGGGVAFVEHAQMVKGAEMMVFSGPKQESLEKAGLVVKRADGKGQFYVALRTKKDNSAVRVIFDKFSNARAPVRWKTHAWEGYDVKPAKKKEKYAEGKVVSISDRKPASAKLPAPAGKERQAAVA